VLHNCLPLTQQFPKQLRRGVRWINPTKKDSRMTARVVQTLYPLSLVIRIKSKTSTIPSTSRYCLLRDDPLCMDSLLPNTWSRVQFHKTCVIVRPWRVRCSYIQSLVILGCLLICSSLSSTNPLPKYEVTTFFRVPTMVQSAFSANDPIGQLCILLGKLPRWTFIMYLTEAKILE
jgi:hypothetical protein